VLSGHLPVNLRRSRLWPRLYVAAVAAPGLLARRRRPSKVRRILIVQHLLLGDTIMLTPLLKKAREQFPQAEIVMIVPRAFACIYQKRPYDVDTLALDPRSLGSHLALRARRGFDLALVPGDNRWSWLARALDSSWIVGFAPDRRSYHEWPMDELRPLPREPMAWGDMAARLLDGPDPAPYRAEEWQAPDFVPYEKPVAPYCVLHIGASNVNKLWPVERWIEIQRWIENRGYAVVLSTGPRETADLDVLDPGGRRSQLAGRLDLAQMWDLLRNAAFVVCPDTGIAHLARLAGVSTVALFGPGSPLCFGPGRFWAHSNFRALWEPEVSCRDQTQLFEREVHWLKQCWRTAEECGAPTCMWRIHVPQVSAALEELLGGGPAKGRTP
jgi:ADP-heptose:LPS heptosyltransferase